MTHGANIINNHPNKSQHPIICGQHTLNHNHGTDKPTACHKLQHLATINNNNDNLTTSVPFFRSLRRFHPSQGQMSPHSQHHLPMFCFSHLFQLMEFRPMPFKPMLLHLLLPTPFRPMPQCPMAVTFPATFPPSIFPILFHVDLLGITSKPTTCKHHFHHFIAIHVFQRHLAKPCRCKVQ